MANYTDKTALEQMHGKDNIFKWADLDNDKILADIADRCELASTIATTYVNGRLQRSKYTVPFTTAPLMVQYLASLIGGIWLYDGRTLSENANRSRDEVSYKRKTAAKLIREILNGQLTLTEALSGTELGDSSFQAPIVLQVADYSHRICCGNDEYIAPYPHGYNCTCWPCVSNSIVLPIL